MLFVVTLLTLLFRFPNIVSLPITIVVVLLFQKNKRKWFEYLAVCFCVLIVYCVIVGLFKDGNLVKGGNLIPNEGGHSLKTLLANYLRDGKIILQYIPVCLLLIIISCAKIQRFYVRIFVDVFFSLFLGVYLFYNVEFGFANWNISLLLSSLLISLYIYLIFRCFDGIDVDKFSNGGAVMIILMLLSLVNPAGSDTGFLKLIWVLLSTIPFLACNIEKIVQSKLFVVIISACVLICLYGHYRNPFGEQSLNNLKYRIDNSQLAGIRTSNDYFRVYENLKNDIQCYNAENIVIYGERSH